MRRAILLAALVTALAGCGGGKSAPEGPASKSKTAMIAVIAPFSRESYLGTTIANGTELGLRRLIVPVGRDYYGFKVKRYDNAASASKAVAATRRAIADHALAIVTDGTGVDASWKLAKDAGIPIGIVYDGASGLVDPEQRPNVFRIAPTNHGLSFRLAEYLVPKGLKLALLTDDTGYGRAGRKDLDHAFSENPESVVARIQIPSTATDLAPQILQARRAHATGLLVWAQPAAIAEALIAARSAGWKVPVYTPPAGEDPLVRQELAGHPSWVDGLTFASGRMTAERGPVPFLSFQAALTQQFGAQQVGVKTSDGRPVTQPPDYAMYPYDFVRLVATALRAARSSDPGAVMSALNQVSIEGANGDHRGFNEKSHEGVVDDDVYFARFKDMTYAPVKDDALSATLPTIPQEG
ncbi:MAG TPA: ABC transporter substrate-binding protein [Gaiellaceae bacterium]|nr:ABC transporter substrate-binding protein [Gaiellaceae bacterium]